MQYVEEPTRNNHILDVVLTNKPTADLRASNDPPFSTSDHNTIKFDLLFETKSPYCQKIHLESADLNVVRVIGVCGIIKEMRKAVRDYEIRVEQIDN